MSHIETLYTIHRDLHALTKFLHENVDPGVYQTLPAAMKVEDYRAMGLQLGVEVDLNALIARLQSEDPKVVRVVFTSGVRNSLIRRGWDPTGDENYVPFDPQVAQRIVTHPELFKSVEYHRHTGNKNFKFKDCSYLIIQHSKLYDGDRKALYEWAAATLPNDTLILFC